MIPEKRIYKIINDLAEETSSRYKEEILRRNMLYPHVVEFFVLALSPQYKFHIKNKFPEVKKELFSESAEWKDIIDELKRLSKKSGVTDSEKFKLAGMCDTRLRHKLVSMILKKNVKCGVSTKTINKVFGGVIETVPYQRCSTMKMIDRVKFPARLEVKEDGFFAYSIVTKDEVIWKTRTNNIIPIDNDDILEELFTLLEGAFSYSIVLSGELRMKGEDGKYLPRKVSNGLFNSICQGANDINQENVHFIVWDILSRKEFDDGISKRKLRDRIGDLTELEPFHHLHKVRSVVVEDMDEVFQKTERWMNKGEEGAVLKDFSSIWKNHTCPLWIKIKAEKECELRVTGWNYAEKGSKYDGMLGSIVCESEDGKLEVNVSGFTDEERLWDWDKHIGKIVTVKFNEVIESKSKKSKKKSMFLPRICRKQGSFVEFRYDKSKADTLKYIMEL